MGRPPNSTRSEHVEHVVRVPLGDIDDMREVLEDVLRHADHAVHAVKAAEERDDAHTGRHSGGPPSFALRELAGVIKRARDGILVVEAMEFCTVRVRQPGEPCPFPPPPSTVPPPPSTPSPTRTDDEADDPGDPWSVN